MTKERIYYLDEYLNPEVYDFSGFDSACVRLGIRSEIINYRYAFYSADVKKDIKRIKSCLSRA